LISGELEQYSKTIEPISSVDGKVNLNRCSATADGTPVESVTDRLLVIPARDVPGIKVSMPKTKTINNNSGMYQFLLNITFIFYLNFVYKRPVLGDALVAV
jgi:hypothetical protein